MSTLTTLDENINVRDELAKTAGLSTGSMSKVDKISASATEEQKEGLRAGELSINRVYKLVQMEEKRQQIE